MIRPDLSILISVFSILNSQFSILSIIAAMPLIRCQKCGQAYDVPAATAVRLPMSVATCACGEWLFGSRSALLARFSKVGDIDEIDLRPYRVDSQQSPSAPALEVEEDDPFNIYPARSVRVIARGADASIDKVFSIGKHPLWIGRGSSHIKLDDAELSLRHCSISMRRGELVVRDADSHTGTFLDGEAIAEAILAEGTHLLRAGGALICIEPTSAPGASVEPLDTESENLTPELFKRLREKGAAKATGERRRLMLVCVEGALAGQRFELIENEITIGREGDVRVPDEYLSRKHFAVTPDGQGGARVRDLGSRNGTFLNTLPARNTRIHPGDEIKAGVNRFILEESD
ncbi:MAG TPA: FHA domain-containing protein [Thermoanaerobaculia bacterium]|nr:FHA domain-containing protein [Thermoanaerobaculia bacterium]